jgi:hypothetical protein
MIIKVSRIFVVLTSIICIILFFFAGKMEIIRSSTFLSYISIYSFIFSIFLYIFPLCFFIYDIYKYYQTKGKIHLYLLITDVILPLIAISLYDAYFSQIRS